MPTSAEQLLALLQHEAGPVAARPVGTPTAMIALITGSPTQRVDLAPPSG